MPKHSSTEMSVTKYILCTVWEMMTHDMNDGKLFPESYRAAHL